MPLNDSEQKFKGNQPPNALERICIFHIKCCQLENVVNY